MRSRVLWSLILGVLLVVAGGKGWQSAPAQARQTLATHLSATQQSSQDTQTSAIHSPQQVDNSVGGLTGYALVLGLLLTVIALVGLRTCARPTRGRAIQHRRL
jgi:hypothetical protein